jgi:hypothetical protein
MSALGTSDMPVVQGVWKPQRQTDPDVSGAWWKLDDDRAHASVFAVVDAISKDQTQREAENLRHARLYSNRALLGLTIGQGSREATQATVKSQSRLTFNVVKSCVDTASAKIAKAKPAPLFLTSDGESSLQRKARLLTKYVEGVFYDASVYSEAQSCFVDACVFGTGALRLYWERDADGSPRLRSERALPWELFVDEEEGYYGKPRQLHHVRQTYADTLVQLFPKFESEIRLAQSTATNPVGSRVVPKVRVVESWHLPSGPKAKDGKHVICVEGATLFSERWDADYFPFCFFRWSDRRVGFWGQGLAEELMDIQVEINRLARSIQVAQQLVANPRVFVEQGSQVVSAHLNNQPGGIVKYAGRPPIFQTPVAMNAEAYQWIDNLYRKAYELTGISMLSAAAQKPAGLDSAVALREYNDSTSERFSLTGQRWEDFHMDVARKVVDMTRRQAERGQKPTINARDGKFLRQIKWSECDLADDKFHLQVFPTSILPTTPAGKLQTVQELVQAGFIGKQQAVALLNFPDLDAFVSLQTAAIEDVRWTIERILEHGDPADADEVSDLELAVEMGMSAVLRAKRNNEPAERVELLRRWVDECRAKLKPPPSQPAADGGQPIAQPEPAPTSDLMPVQGAAA